MPSNLKLALQKLRICKHPKLKIFLSLHLHLEEISYLLRQTYAVQFKTCTSKATNMQTSQTQNILISAFAKPGYNNNTIARLVNCQLRII